jgi:hypothetical protein
MEKMPTHFRLSIECENDAMSTPQDIARALREVATKIEQGTHSGRILDVNGNRVGSFQIVEADG